MIVVTIRITRQFAMSRPGRLKEVADERARGFDTGLGTAPRRATLVPMI